VATELTASQIPWQSKVRLIAAQRLEYLGLAAVVAVAAALRFYRLGDWSFWIDEVFTVNRALAQMLDPSFRVPLSVRLTGISLNTFGVSEWSARLVPAIFGLVSIPILYLATRRVFGPRIALVAMLLLAISPWHIFWSQNARFYSALLLFYALATFFFYAWLKADRARYLLLSISMLVLAFVERAIALVFLPAAITTYVAWAWLPGGQRRSINWKIIALLLIPAVPLAAYLPVLFGELLGTHVGFQHNPIRVLLAIAHDMGIPLVVFGFAGGVILARRDRQQGLFFLISATAPVILLVLISPFVLVTSRYVFVVLPLWAILGAVAVSALYDGLKQDRSVLMIGVVLLLVADAAGQDLLYYNYQNGNRENWKAAFALVQGELRDGDRVFSTRSEMGRYYLEQRVRSTFQLEPAAIVEANQRTWFVVDRHSGTMTPALRRWLETETSLQGVFDVYLPGKLMPMRVYLYTP
jgi:mannosyltransferase